jgi:hypothetical protein
VGYNVDPALFEKLNAVFEAIQPRTDALVDFDERERLVAQLRPAVEEGRGVWRMGSAYLSATKPR